MVVNPRVVDFIHSCVCTSPGSMASCNGLIGTKNMTKAMNIAGMESEVYLVGKHINISDLLF